MGFFWQIYPMENNVHRNRFSRIHFIEFVITFLGFAGVVTSGWEKGLASDMPKGELPEEESSTPAEEAQMGAKKNSPTDSSPISPGKSPQEPSVLSPEKAPDDTKETEMMKSGEKRCLEGYLGLTPQQMIFDSQGRYLYLLVDSPLKNLEPKDKVKKQNSAQNTDLKKTEPDKKSPSQLSQDAMRTRKTIVRVDIKTGQRDPLMSSVLRADAVLMHQLGGISALNFVGSPSECGTGKAMIVSINISNKAKGTKAVQHSGSFRMVQSPAGWILADLKKNVILEMDSEQFQKRTIRKILPEGIPLYFNDQEQVLVHWVAKPPQKGILFERGNISKTQKKVAVPQGEFLIVSRSGLAVASKGKNQNLVIQTLKGLNTELNSIKFSILLPSDLQIEQLSFDIDISKSHGLALGHDLSTRKSLAKAWIYDLSKPDPLAIVEPSSSGYVQAALLSPDGETAAFKIGDKESSGSDIVRLFDFKTREFRDFPLDRLLPKAPKENAP